MQVYTVAPWPWPTNGFCDECNVDSGYGDTICDNRKSAGVHIGLGRRMKVRKKKEEGILSTFVYMTTAWYACMHECERGVDPGG